MSTPELSHRLRVVAAQIEGRGQVFVRLAPEDDGFSRAHTEAGQYVWIEHPLEKSPKPIVLTSAPGEPTAELLVKPAAADGLQQWLRTDVVCASSAPQGPGIPIVRSPASDWLLVAGGSGIAAVRPVVENAIACGLGARCHLLYGARAPEDFAFPDDHPRWVEQLATCRFVCSRADASWSGLRGYVQAHLPWEEMAGATTRVFVCGPRPMERDLYDVLVAKGFPERAFVRNY